MRNDKGLLVLYRKMDRNDIVERLVMSPTDPRLARQDATPTTSSTHLVPPR